MARRGRTMAMTWLTLLILAVLLPPAMARGAEQVGTTFPADFPVILDASLGVPVIGFGAAGRVRRTPVIFLHGNNDTPFPTAMQPARQDSRRRPVLSRSRLCGRRALGSWLPGRSV